MTGNVGPTVEGLRFQTEGFGFSPLGSRVEDCGFMGFRSMNTGGMDSGLEDGCYRMGVPNWRSLSNSLRDMVGHKPAWEQRSKGQSSSSPPCPTPPLPHIPFFRPLTIYVHVMFMWLSYSSFLFLLKWTESSLRESPY